MARLEDELKDLREKNNELVQKVQYWKMTAAQRENEKLNLMKEINELRLKLSRLRSNGSVQASNLDTALQSASEKALAHLVRASSEIARTMDLAKAYMRDRQELDAASPRWSSIGSTPTSVKKDKVHRVPPLMMGGQSIQPVVALTMLNTSHTRSAPRSPNRSRNVTERAVPMHMLQDVYIPLTRIDAGDMRTQNMETETEANADDSTEDLELEDSEERVVDDSQQMSEDEDFDSSRKLDAVAEDLEPEDEAVTPPRSSTDNPLEGPSWMLDASTDQTSASKSRTNLEPDSTTELEEVSLPTPPVTVNKWMDTLEVAPPSASCAFSPTVRRRKRTSTPPPPATPRRPSFSPRPLCSRRPSNSGRVLKVVVAKMRLDGAVGDARGDMRGVAEGAGSPPKRPSLEHFDAPSPNGATVAGVIVSETRQNQLNDDAAGEPAPPPAGTDSRTSNYSASLLEDSRPVSRSCRRRSRDSESSSSGADGGSGGEGRTRRTRKVVTYKEKPLNRKLRR